MADLLDVPEAARRMGVDPSRVRALIHAGDLDAQKLGGRWVIEPASIAARRRQVSSNGRPFAPLNAWSLLLLSSGEKLPERLDSVGRWRIRQALANQGLERLRPRLRTRARPQHYWGLPGELRALMQRRDLVASGSSAASFHGLNLLGPDAVDVYLPASELDVIAREHALQPASAGEANVILRAVPDAAWVLSGRPAAPRAAVALDLAEYPDSRSARAGRDLVVRLDRQRPAASR
ncbi:MAG: helix-turn-helix domain-containing protein [Solirubrobacteraceae bacterium]